LPTILAAPLMPMRRGTCCVLCIRNVVSHGADRRGRGAGRGAQGVFARFAASGFFCWAVGAPPSAVPCTEPGLWVDSWSCPGLGAKRGNEKEA
jgi:hypothetical protein